VAVQHGEIHGDGGGDAKLSASLPGHERKEEKELGSHDTLEGHAPKNRRPSITSE
jgi:hypothetical protein